MMQGSVVVDKTRHAQAALYNRYFLDLVRSRADFVMVIDLDEFVYARKLCDTVSSVKSLRRSRPSGRSAFQATSSARRGPGIMVRA